MAIDEATAQPPAWCAHRRALLAGLGGIGAAALLAACGDDSTTTPAAADSPGAGASGAASGGAAKTPVADTAQVPVGGGIVVNGLLVTQPTSGTFMLFDAACPHKGILVSPPQDGVVTCPAHASKFKLADGSKIDGPTPTGLKLLKSAVDGTEVVRLEQ
ncbi:Rieske (2Fe-2S) protein [Dactylosporangium sp. CA-233914]|uniref:Rieske (2Fe-2S) protein n=1 Tax=Dactylosporangium sp. CA-233914 TaxID=3239934 RepID=UPI003D9343D3